MIVNVLYTHTTTLYATNGLGDKHHPRLDELRLD